MTIVAIPFFLRIWIALQVLGFVLGPLLAPDERPGRLMWLLVTAMLMLILGWAMYKRAKGAWVVAVFFATWSTIGGLPALWMWNEGLDQNFVWLTYGLVLGVAELWVLLSRPARDWVNQPTERKWTYESS